MRILIACTTLALAGSSFCTAGSAEPVAAAPSTELIAEPVPVHASLPAPVNRLTGAAIWVNPLDKSASRIIITNQARGIEVHDLAGYLLKHLDEGYETDSLTILRGFPLAGKPTDLVLATYPDERVRGVAMWFIQPEKAKLKQMEEGDDRFVVPDNSKPLGITAYHSHKTGRYFVFVTSETGTIDQIELTGDKNGAIATKPVRRLNVPSKTQGCIADDDRGLVYFSEEKKGVWRFDAEPDGDQQGKKVIKVGEHGLIPDVEGICLYALPESKGYLIVVGQGTKTGRSRLNVYDRQDYHYVGAIVPSAANGNAVEFAGGVAATSMPLPEFPEGLLLIRDHLNPNGSEDFKYYSWADCAKALNLKTTSASEKSPAQ